MPLILAIEPDRRQAGQLTALVKGRLHAEVVIGDSAETALAALGSRVPDLVLTTALLSPRDESALSERLRALDGAAAHVQTLTIPVLATTSRRRGGKGGGVLSGLLGDSLSDDSVTRDGCDPAVFAEQCKGYLERAAAERAISIERQNDRIERELPPLPAPVFQPAVSHEAVPQRDTAPQHDGPTHETAPQSEAALQYEPVGAYETAPTYEAAQVSRRAPIYRPPMAAGAQTREDDTTAAATDADDIAQPAAAVEPQAASTTALIVRPERSENRKFKRPLNNDEPPAALLAAVAAFADIEEPSTYAAVETAENAETATTELAAEPEVQERSFANNDLADVDLSSLFDDMPRRAAEAEVEDGSSIPVYDIDASTFDTEPLFVDAAEHHDSAHESNESVSMPTIDAGAVPAAPAATSAPRTKADELREWNDILEALRRDVHSTVTPVQAAVESAPEAAAAPPAVAAPDPVDTAAPEPVLEHVTAAPDAVVPDAAVSEAAPADPGPPRRKGRRKASVEDEWGFFDPDRAGFAALLAKLEEITEDDSAKPKRKTR